jgi:hypothetical protein
MTDKDVERVARMVEAAYREGWRVNAIPADEHDAGAEYVNGCETHDWLASEARAAVAACESAVGERARELEEENARLLGLLNTPEVEDWAKGVALEASHQRERWGAEHDAGKTPFDWFWLVGYLAQKAATAAVAGDVEKAKHHTISTGAVLANWHLALSGTDTRMRPGIDPTERKVA